MSVQIDAAAERLIYAAATREPCPPVRELIGAGNVHAAYEVQQRVVAHHTAAGRKVVGRKVGLTSKVVQAQLGVDAPDFGVLLDDMAYVTREPISCDRFLQPRVEAEVAFVMGQNLIDGAISAASVISATEYVLPAVEIVDSRVANWDITLADTIADNASSGAFVLGTTPRRLENLDLASVGMSLERDGQVLSTGAGAACLGDPVAAVVWLAKMLASVGQPLLAGDIVLSGALGPVVPVSPGTFTARISGLGEVVATFESGASQ
ncbi:2-keto-4-pentenoate hydratase [Nocardioides sp. LS1]|uniref:2-keto-4-pentenoate hydratase n=1 Tax=Nocardioides sp. LS1 TaxID=1027620 RepID=UPI000F6214C2|nr:fumarylacetoacetate hydrolase family protein [Nocardioides sp. LS1]